MQPQAPARDWPVMRQAHTPLHVLSVDCIKDLVARRELTPFMRACVGLDVKR